MRMSRSTLGGTRTLGACATGALLLSSCTGGDQQDGGNEAEQDGQAGDHPGSIADFCESAPEVTDEDQARVLEVGMIPEGSAEEVPMPYAEQLAEDTGYQPPSEDGPAENVPHPEFSALLCDEEGGQDGASAALSQWFEFYRYGELTGDDQLLEQLVAEECAECENALEEIRQLEAEGLWIDGDPMHGQLHMWQIDEDPEAPIGFVESVVPEYTLYGAEGEVESSGGFDDTFGFEFAYVDEVGHWQMVSQRDAAMGDDVFEGDGSDDGSADVADIETPEMPAEAEENTPEGALAAFDHWLETFDYVVATGDSEPIEAMNHPENERLSDFYVTFSELYADGGHAELQGESELQGAEVYFEDVQTEDAVIIAGNGSEPGWDVFDENGELIAEEEGVQEEPVIYALMYNAEAGHWQLVETHPIGIDEFLAEAGMEDAEPDLTR